MGLKELRNKKRISAQELAKLCNMSFRTIQEYELGGLDINKASIRNIINMATVLDCGIDELLTDPELQKAYILLSKK